MIFSCKYIPENLSGKKDSLKKSFTGKTSSYSVHSTFFILVLFFCSEYSVLLKN